MSVGSFFSSSRLLSAALLALVAGGILFGGGGAEGPFNNGIIEAAAALVLLILTALHFTGTRPLPPASAVPLLLLLALLCLAGAQLVPLPPGVWTGLPGRELERNALSLIGQDASWRPLSLDPEATRRLVASLFVPAAIMVAVLGATRNEARTFCKTIVFAATVSGFIGALQIALAYPALLTFYDGATPGTASGVFANPNHHGTMLLVGLVCLGAWIRLEAGRSKQRPGVRTLPWAIHPAWIVLPFLVAIVLATKSRASAALLLLALPMAVGIAVKRRALLFATLAVGLLATVGFVAAAFSPGAQSLIAARAGALSHDQRFSYLSDVLFGIGQYWPWGSGGGTFAAVFATFEDLDRLQPELLNHAHNEYLEWLTEFGAPAALLLLLFVGSLIWRFWRVFGSRPKQRGSDTAILAGLSILVLLGCHSAVEYPMRTDALAAVAGLGIGLVFAALPDVRIAGRRPRYSTAILILSLIVGGLCAAQVIRLRLAESGVRSARPFAALALRWQNGDALGAAAQAQFLGGNRASARTLAMAAIDRSPMSANAVSVLAASSGRDGEGDPKAWQVASAMGWRDKATQLWALRQAFVGREYATAAARADALLRTDKRPEFMKIVRSAASDPGFRAALVERIRLSPQWRGTFFEIGPGVSEPELEGVVGTASGLGRIGELTRSDARGAILLLLDRKQYEAAYRIYSAVSPRPPADSLNPDPGFARPLSDYLIGGTPFEWQLSPGPGTVAEVDPSAHSLVIETNGKEARRAAYRYLLVRPGAYALDYRVRGSVGAATDIQVRVECADGLTVLGTAPNEELEPGGFQRRRILFEVPRSCPAIAIGFMVLGNGSAADAEFDDVLISTR